MSKRISLSSIGVVALWLAAGSLVAVEPIPALWAAAPTAPPSATAPSNSPSAPATTKSSAKSGRLALDGVDYYYEVHGAGEPLSGCSRSPMTWRR